MSGHPAGGGVPDGMASVPEIAIKVPFADNVSYSTRQFLAAEGNEEPPVNGCAQTIDPSTADGSGRGGL